MTILSLLRSNSGDRMRFDLHCARVYLAEARRRRNQPAFHAVLLEWAANCRRRARGQMEMRL